jgi:hypothetical protein
MARPKVVVNALSGAYGRRQTPKENRIRIFVLTSDELKKMRGHHGFNYWRVACDGCKKRFNDSDIGETIVSVPMRNRPKIYYHRKCFNDKKGRAQSEHI